eukprot:jgi/Mesvir1/21810/Mv04199-RA.2
MPLAEGMQPGLLSLCPCVSAAGPPHQTSMGHIASLHSPALALAPARPLLPPPPLPPFSLSLSPASVPPLTAAPASATGGCSRQPPMASMLHTVPTDSPLTPHAACPIPPGTGELATARAAKAAGTLMTLSSWATSSVEEVASVGPAPRFFQLYVYKDRKVVEQLVRRAERAGFNGIALTVDTPKLGRRWADMRNKFSLPPGLSMKNFEGLEMGVMNKASGSGLAAYVAGQIDPSLSWKDITWLKSITSLPILVKGVLTAEDAKLSIQYGAAGIIVSNHGARQLDYVPATIDALEEVVGAVQGRIPVLLDGGVRRGTDVLKALALGAKAVFVGRPVVFGLAAAGEDGVRNVLQILRDEFELAMMLSGLPSLKDVHRGLVTTERDRLKAACTGQCHSKL